MNMYLIHYVAIRGAPPEIPCSFEYWEWVWEGLKPSPFPKTPEVQGRENTVGQFLLRVQNKNKENKISAIPRDTVARRAGNVD